MSPFEAYQLYLAVRNHFTGQYDFFKYHGKVNVKLETYNKRQDKRWFAKLANKKDPKGMLLANIIEQPPGSALWIGDLLDEAVYRKWKGRQESLEYKFHTEVQQLFHLLGSDFVYDSRQLFKLYSENQVLPETLCLLDRIFHGNMLESWPQEDLYEAEVIKLLQRYSPFIAVEKEKVVAIYKEIVYK